MWTKMATMHCKILAVILISLDLKVNFKINTIRDNLEKKDKNKDYIIHKSMDSKCYSY